MTAKTKKPEIDLGIGSAIAEIGDCDDSIPGIDLYEAGFGGTATVTGQDITLSRMPGVPSVTVIRSTLPETLSPAADDASYAQLQVCLDDFGFTSMDAKELMDLGTEELNQSLLKACRAGAAFWAAQEALKNATTTGVVDTFKGFIENRGLSEPRVYECIKIAKFYARLPEAQRGKVLTIGKKQALLLARTPQEVIDRAAENGQDMIGEAETMTYDQLRENLRAAERRGKQLESEIEHRDAVITKMKQRNPVYQFGPETHFVREECLVFQAECELALNSICALFEGTANEEETSPERRMRLEQIWVTAHVAAARAIDMLNKIKSIAPVSDLPESIGSVHTLTDAEAVSWLQDYPLIERKHFAAQAEREKQRQSNQPKGRGRPRKED